MDVLQTASSAPFPLPEPARTSSSADRILASCQTLLIGLSGVLFLRCQTSPGWCVLLALVLPLLRWLISAPFRQQARGSIRRLWSDLQAFPGESAFIPWRATLALIVLPASLFFLSQGRPILSGDTKPVTLTAASLVLTGRCELSTFSTLHAADNCYNVPGELPYFLRRTPAGVYSSYSSGMVLFALPQTLLGRLLGAGLDRIRVHDRLEKNIASLLAAGCLGLFFLLALHLADARSAVAVTVLLAVGSALCSTVAQALWQHGGVLFWLLAALLVEFRTWPRPSLAGSLFQGFAVAQMLACRLTAVVLLVPLGLWVLWRAPRRAAVIALAGTLAYLPWAWFYHSVYGTPLGPALIQADGSNWSWPSPGVLTALLFSPDHGLLSYQPWLLLGLAWPAVLAGKVSDGRDKGMAPPGWQWVCLAGLVLHLGLISTWRCWWGGDCWGSRLATEAVLPGGLVCVHPVALLLRQRRGWLVLAAGLLSVLMHLPGVCFQADYRDHQPGLFGGPPLPPGSWTHAPFLTPFLPRR
jgi:hypothetical protein